MKKDEPFQLPSDMKPIPGGHRKAASLYVFALAGIVGILFVAMVAATIIGMFVAKGWLWLRPAGLAVVAGLICYSIIRFGIRLRQWPPPGFWDKPNGES